LRHFVKINRALPTSTVIMLHSPKAWQRWLFSCLLIKADDYGRLKADPRLLRHFAFAESAEFDTVSLEEIQGYLETLDKRGVLQLYSNSDGEACASFFNWRNYQQLPPSRWWRSHIEPPPDDPRRRDEEREPEPTAEDAEAGTDKEPKSGLPAVTAPDGQALSPDDAAPFITCVELITGDKKATYQDREAWLGLRAKHEPATILEVVRWATAHPFWRQNLLTFAGLAQRKPGSSRASMPSGKSGMRVLPMTRRLPQSSKLKTNRGKRREKRKLPR